MCPPLFVLSCGRNRGLGSLEQNDPRNGVWRLLVNAHDHPIQVPDIARVAPNTFGGVTVTIALQESESHGVGMLTVVASLTAGAKGGAL